MAHLMPWGLPARYALYPVQTLVCAGVLAWFWREYRLTAPRLAWFAVLAALVSAALWVSVFPLLIARTLPHQPPRVDGFDPNVFAANPALYWTELVLRFTRLVVVVPILEEIFWRGFLLRWVIDENFTAVSFGTYRRTANFLVAVGFMLEHSLPDYPAALVTGLLYNMVAFRTRSLSSCILAHAVTNALLGCFIMATRQWGFW